MVNPGRPRNGRTTIRDGLGCAGGRGAVISSSRDHPFMAKRPPTVPDSELEVIKVLWDRGQGTVREILETLKAAGRPWSYATVATLLDRLETKGMVTSDRSELAFVYRPAVTAQDVRQKRVNHLVDKLYQGEPGLLVLPLLKSHPLDSDQAKQVRALLAEMTDEAAQGRD